MKPSFSLARRVRAEIEELANRWAEQTGGALTIIRAATTLARGRENGLANLLRNSAALRNAEGDAPAQFLHAEDFAKAVEVVVVMLGRHFFRGSSGSLFFVNVFPRAKRCLLLAAALGRDGVY